MRRTTAGVLMLSLVITGSGCAGMTRTQKSTVVGGATGAAGGAIIGAIAGDAGMGAAIGAGVGVVGGFLYGKHEESRDAAYQQGVRDGEARRR